MMEQSNVTWPGWEVVRKIGSGSFGAVYEIRRDVFGREERAALKVLSIPENQEEIEELYNGGESQESITTHYKTQLSEIVREYSLMLDLKGHSNVVYCDDLKYLPHDDGIGWDLYIKMELLTPLMKALGAEYSEEQTVRLGIDMCNALVLCKQRNIIHRDIKPQNIFISNNGDYKLGDFGVAKVSEKTANGTTAGTYEYMAPEVCFGQAYGSGADLYSLGLVLYWMMNRRRTPFQPWHIPSTMEKEAARERRLKGEALPEPVNGSDELKRIVLKACAYDPKERYASAADMREDLKKLDTGVAFVPPVQEAAAAEPEEGTVNILGGASAAEGTVNIFSGSAGSFKLGTDAFEEKTEYIPRDSAEEKTEYIREEKTVYIPRQTAVQVEEPEKKKKKGKGILFILLAVVAVIVVVLLMLKSCGGEAKPSETPGQQSSAGEQAGSQGSGEETRDSQEESSEMTDGSSEGTEGSEETGEESEENTETTQTEKPADVSLTAIEIGAKPTKTDYNVGDSLNTAGLTLKLTYSDGSTKTVTDGFTCTPNKLDAAGTQKIRVSYGGKETSFSVQVTENIPFSLGKGYKLAVYQGNKGKTYYFAGSINAYYQKFLATSLYAIDAVDVYVEKATGGYRLYFYDTSSQKTYIDAYYDDEGRILPELTSTPEIVYTWNSQYETFCFSVEEESGTKEYYVGCYNTYDTISISDVKWLATSFPIQLIDDAQLAQQTEVMLEDGDRVVIYSPSAGVALSAEKDGYYNVGTTVWKTNGGYLNGYSDTTIWTIVKNSDGTWGFSYDGQLLGLFDSYKNFDLGAPYNKWEIISLGDGRYLIRNIVREDCYFRWFDSYQNWSVGQSDDPESSVEFVVAFYLM